ncbi:carboxylesterase/lipase family protein [Nannocystaceae bacterium ST9]
MLERRAAVIAWLSLTLACGDAGGDDDEIGDASTDTHASTSESADTETSEGETCALGPATIEVETTAGPLVGALDEGVARFSNIPYAAPPIGELRFAPPQPPIAWTEPRDAGEFGEPCMQLAVSGDDPSTIGSEDCLQLNVWTARACSDGDRPVLVFLHGGGNATGSAIDPLYEGAELVRREDVVVVTVAYRLGVLGWLATPELDAEAGHSGNYGLADQLAALEWVQANIDRFGGDPSKVMLFGESAGAVDTCAVIGSPQAQGLVAGAVVQSGTCNQPGRIKLDLLADEFVANSGCAGPDLLACLRERPASELVFVSPNGFPSVSGLAQGWGPHVDGVLLPSSSLDALAAGEVGIPLVIGNNADETAKDTPPGMSEAEYEALIDAYFGLLAPQVLAAYPVIDYVDPSDAWSHLTSDVKFVCNARRSAVASAQGGQPTWRYVFTYTGYESIGNTPKYAFHGLELIYQFGNWGAVELGNFEYQPNPDDLAMRDAMMAAWTDFAASGEFVGAAYDPTTDPWYGFGSLGMAGYRTAQCDFWDQYL